MAETKAVQRKADLLPAPIITLIQGLIPDCNALLPPDITTEQFRAGLWLELTGRAGLKDCSIDSLRTCIVEAAQDGMLPGRDCVFLPFAQKGSPSKRATKVDQYPGLQRALERTGKVVHSWAAPVCENDECDFNRFLPQPIHREAMTMGKPPGKELFYYGAILFKDGHCAFETISLEAIDAVRRSAPAHEAGPWRDWPEMMKRKTALKRVCKYVPVTPEIVRMVEADDARMQQDIPAERHQQNIIELFGEGGGAPHAPRGSAAPLHEAPSPWCDDCNTAGHASEECPSRTHTQGMVTTSPPGASTASSSAGEHTSAPPRGQKRASSEEPGWKQTLRAQRDTLGQMVVGGVYTTDARARLDALLEQIDFALSPLGTGGGTEGENLAAAVLEWVQAAQA